MPKFIVQISWIVLYPLIAALPIQAQIPPIVPTQNTVNNTTQNTVANRSIAPRLS